MTLAAGGSARLIRETLDSVVAPAVRDALVSSALDESALDDVPSDPEQFRQFVEGPLRDALVKGLGNELADSIVDELERMAQLTDQPSSTTQPVRRAARTGQQRSASPPPRRNTPTHRRSISSKPGKGTLPTGVEPPRSAAVPSSKPRSDEPVDPNAMTMPPPSPDRRPALARIGLTPPPLSAPSSGTQSRPTGGWGSDEYPAGAAGTLGLPGAPDSAALAKGRPYVLIATADATLVRRLTPWLDATAELVLLSSVRELIKDLEALGDARVAVLIDCRKPSIRPTAVAALADELPSHVSVVLWGASPEQERGVLAVSPAVSRWIVLHGDTRPKELAQRCANLVG